MASRERKPRKPRPPLAEAGLFDYASRLLASRMRTERELRRLLVRRAEPGPPGATAVDAVIARLLDLNFLSDARFAADYTRVRKEGQKFGRRRVAQDLAARGVPRDLAAPALEAAYDNTDELALAREYVARKRIQPPVGPKESARVLARLVRAGFTAATAFRLLRQWGMEVEEWNVGR